MIYGYKKLSKPEDWKDIVGARNWRPTRSAYELAHKWHRSGRMPPLVRKAFEQSANPLFRGLSIHCLYVERPTFLDTFKAPSYTDIMVHCRTRDNRPLIVGVEGKANEPFDAPVRKWIAGKGASEKPSRVRRLEFLSSMLGVPIQRDSPLRYQLVHRTAAIVHQAALAGAIAAVVLVHSFAEQSEDNWHDFQAFLRHLKVEPTLKGVFAGPCLLGSCPQVKTYFVWITDAPVRPKAS
jgi:hypothetical protein